MTKYFLIFALALTACATRNPASTEVVSSENEDVGTPAVNFNGKKYRTPYGDVVLSGRYIGEGATNYQMKAVLNCKNGRKQDLFDFKFCDFKNTADVFKGNFSTWGRRGVSYIKFEYLADKVPDASGMAVCTNATAKMIRVQCGMYNGADNKAAK